MRWHGHRRGWPLVFDWYLPTVYLSVWLCVAACLACFTLLCVCVRVHVLPLFTLQVEEFRLVVEQLAKVLVADKGLPLLERTIHPVASGGIAGGEKFVVGNVFLKFPSDTHGLYGGARECVYVCFPVWMSGY